jgi:DNA-binding FadR family transcriptional regulator
MATGAPIVAFNLTPAPIPAASDVLAEYRAITGGAADTYLAPRVAMAIEDALSHARWPVGRVCGPEVVLADNFNVSVRVLRQAFRILEARGACRPRRGPSGGLIILSPDRQVIGAAMANHLRWTGVDDDEVWVARDLIEPLAAASAARGGGRERGEGGPSLSSIAALAPPFLGLSLTCLEQFGGGLSDSPPGLARALSAAIASGSAQRAFDLAREGVKMRRAVNRTVVTAHAPAALGSGVGFNLAAGVAAKISAEIHPEACRNGDRLGTVTSLAERHCVSPGVMIEAVRLLEDAGVARSANGRGGGVRLRQPDPAAIITSVHGYLAAHDAGAEADLNFHLNAWASGQAAQVRSIGDSQELLQLWKLIEAAPESVMKRAWYGVQRRLYEIAGNRPLHLLGACFAGFTVRSLAPVQQPWSTSLVDAIQEVGRTIVRGVVERDGKLADQGHDYARSLFMPGPRSLLRA